jgi:hypothetical protein
MEKTIVEEEERKRLKSHQVPLKYTLKKPSTTPIVEPVMITPVVEKVSIATPFRVDP